MSRRNVIAALVVATAVVVAVIAVVRGFGPTTRYIYGAAATGPGEAVLLTRLNSRGGPPQFWIEHVDVATGLRWSVETTPLEPEDALGFTAIATAEDRLVALAQSSGHDVALALDRASGRRLWESTLPETIGRSRRVGLQVLVDGPRVYLFRETVVDGKRADRIDARALADGAPLWTREIGSSSQLHLLAPGRLFVHDRKGGGSVLDGTTGEVVRTLGPTGLGCAVPGGIVVMEAGRATIVAADDTAWRSEPGPWTLWRDPLCGARGDEPVLLARDDEKKSMSLMRFDRSTGAPRWRIDRDKGVAPPVTVDGRLPRWLPLNLYRAPDAPRDPQTYELGMVDLDTGALRRRGATKQLFVVLASAERAWVWFRLKGVLVGLDPETGDLADARRFTANMAENIEHDDIAAGELWIFGKNGGTPSTLPWAAVDLTTGQLLRANASMQARDVTEELRAELGWE